MLVVAAGLTVDLTHDADQADVVTVALQGTPLAGEGAGEVTMTRTESGWRIELEAGGLPRRDDGAFYEAWLKNDAGALGRMLSADARGVVTKWLKSAIAPRVRLSEVVQGDVARPEFVLEFEWRSNIGARRSGKTTFRGRLAGSAGQARLEDVVIVSEFPPK